MTMEVVSLGSNRKKCKRQRESCLIMGKAVRSHMENSIYFGGILNDETPMPCFHLALHRTSPLS